MKLAIIGAGDVGGTLGADPVFHGVKSVTFVAGDDAAAKPKVMALGGELGFGTVDAGRIARLEPHAMLWIHLALNHGFGGDWGLALERH